MKKPKKEDRARDKTFQAPRGMHDVAPADQQWWDRITRVGRELADFYNFGRIETPILESARLFERGIGEETDAVQKEMFIVKTKGGDVFALRPEGTAGVM